MKIFVPFSEALVDEFGLSIGELVPFELEYQCLRMYDSGVLAASAEEAFKAPEFDAEPEGVRESIAAASRS